MCLQTSPRTRRWCEHQVRGSPGSESAPDAFGTAGLYNRWLLARLYGSRRLRVVRGARTDRGRVVEVVDADLALSVRRPPHAASGYDEAYPHSGAMTTDSSCPARGGICHVAPDRRRRSGAGDSLRTADVRRRSRRRRRRRGGCVAPEDKGFFNYSDYEQTTLRQVRFGMTALVRLSDRISVLGELRSENFEYVTPFALYARIRPAAEPPIDIQIGRIPPTFGSSLHDEPTVTTIRSSARRSPTST